MDKRPVSVSEERDGFVGRERELRALVSALATVRAGQGAIVTLAGPAGIGKSRLCEELSTVFRRRGVTVLRSYCHEEPAAPPYWPWTRLLELYAAGTNECAFERLPDEDRAQIAPLLPELSPAETPGSGRPPGDSGGSRFRLFDTLSRFWLDAARRAPLVLVLEDLHWCDVPSLKLLEFLAHDLATAPLMLVLTFRDDELERRHPLSDTLGELARRTTLQRLPLGGLARDETARLIRAVTGRTPSPGHVTQLHERSEGNPFYLLELVRFLASAVSGTTEHAAPIPADALETVPDGVRAVVGRRLNRLSSTCERLLGVAAIIGRDFSVTLLGRLLETQSEEGLWDALDEARAAHVVEPVADEPDRHRFAHALIRETLYEEMLPARRRRLHLRCGGLLEELCGDGDGPHLSQLAYHFAAAVPLGEAGRAVALAERAARYASSRLAHEEAARLYGLALTFLSHPQTAAGDGHEEGERHRCELLIGLGSAQGRAGEVLEALESLNAAAEVASEHRLASLAACAAVAFEDVSWRPGLSGDKAVALLNGARALLGSPTRENRDLLARVLAALSRAYGFGGDHRQADRLHEEAVALAQGCGDHQALLMTLRTSVWDRWRPERLAARLRDTEEALALAAHADDPLQQTVDLLGWYLFDLLESGDMGRIETELARYEQLATELREPFYNYVHDTFRAGLAFHRGHFAEFEGFVERAYRTGARIQGHNADGPYGLQMFSLERERGRLAALAPLVERFVRAAPATMTWRPGLALIYAEIGDALAARREFDTLAANGFEDLPHDGTRTCSLAYVAEVCAWLDDRERATTLYDLLEPYGGHNLVVGAAIVCYGSADRYLGMLATTTARWQLAEAHFERALASDARSGAAPWLAHTRERYAAMLARRGRPRDRARASELLAAAASDAIALGMTKLERDARALAERLATGADAGRLDSRARAPDELSRREFDVLRLLAEGARNRDIAERLFISRHTVANHVRNILAKTATANRTEAVAHARRAGLLDE